MVLAHLFLIHRFKIASVHYVTPTDDNYGQAQGMQALGLYRDVNTEAGQMIVATVNTQEIQKLLNSDPKVLERLINKA